MGLETIKALIEKSENDAQLDEFGYMRPSLIPLQVISTIIPTLYPRFTEIIQLIGASGMVTPTENAFDSEIREDLDQYLQATNTNAEERENFPLGLDLTMSSFGTRETHYERYFSEILFDFKQTVYKLSKAAASEHD